MLKGYDIIVALAKHWGSVRLSNGIKCDWVEGALIITHPEGNSVRVTSFNSDSPGLESDALSAIESMWSRSQDSNTVLAIAAAISVLIRNDGNKQKIAGEGIFYKYYPDERIVWFIRDNIVSLGVSLADGECLMKNSEDVNDTMRILNDTIELWSEKFTLENIFGLLPGSPCGFDSSISIKDSNTFTANGNDYPMTLVGLLSYMLIDPEGYAITASMFHSYPSTETFLKDIERLADSVTALNNVNKTGSNAVVADGLTRRIVVRSNTRQKGVLTKAGANYIMTQDATPNDIRMLANAAQSKCKQQGILCGKVEDVMDKYLFDTKPVSTTREILRVISLMDADVSKAVSEFFGKFLSDIGYV